MKKAWIVLGVVALDQATKALAVRFLQGGTGLALLPGVLGLRYAENTGMAFSLFAGRGWLLGLLSLGILLGAGLLLRRYRLGKWASLAATLMLGGALGNMIDRFFTGYVVDMMEILLFRFAIFNLADVALTVGAVLMGVTLLWMPKEWSEKKRGDTNGKTV